MTLTPLTRVQQATLPALVEARRLDVVPADLARSASFLRQAQELLDQLPLLTSQDRYEAKPVGAAATEKAVQVARTPVGGVTRRAMADRFARDALS